MKLLNLVLAIASHLPFAKFPTTTIEPIDSITIRLNAILARAGV